MMLPPARAGFAATAAGLALVLGAVAPATASTAGSDDPALPDKAPTATPSGSTVTLITGDVVHVSSLAGGRETVTVDTVDGDPTSYETVEIGGDLYVLPDAADAYLRSGAIDKELFNISHLVELGYDDASSAGIPVIAQYNTRLRAKPVTPNGAEKKLDLSSIGGAALHTDSAQSEDFWASLTATNTRTAAAGGLAGGMTKLWLDGQASASLDVSVPLVGAPEAWAEGYDGSGSTVVVLDTGIDVDHADVKDAVVGTKSFVPGESVNDGSGHGTHVAATIAGSGASGGGAGVAPGADLVIGKVLGDAGYGMDSWIIAGMEWAAEEVGADVVNMSLGDNELTGQDNPMAIALNELTAEYGTLFVVAAGNDGGSRTVGSPGTADAALTVAATDDRDRLASFSSRGPRDSDDALKPDIAAPGVGIVAARSQYSSGSGLLSSKSGTSMATPHVSGAAAILAAQHPEWSAERLKDALMSSAKELDYTAYEVGTGRLDIPATLDGIDATGSVYFGKVAWGLDDPAEPTTETITYRNATNADLALTLTSTTEGPNGAVDLLQLSADEITVPAGGEVTVELTLSDYTLAADPGHYLGEVVATDAEGTAVAHTTTGFTREDERYDLDVTVLGLDGAPVQTSVSMYQYGTTNLVQSGTDATTGAIESKRVAPGVWAVSTKIELQLEDGTDRLYWLTEPHVEIAGGDAEVLLDARSANPISFDSPRPSAMFNQRVEWYHDSGIGGALSSFYSAIPSAPQLEVWTNPLESVGGGEYDLTARWVATAPPLTLKALIPGQGVVTFDTLYQASSARLDGAFDFELVDVGTGTPAEIAAIDAEVDLEGKALLVTHDSSAGILATIFRANAAIGVGASFMIVINDEPGTLYTSAGTTALPVVSISAEDGATLLAAGAGRHVTGKGTRYVPYTYNVSHTWRGSVPTDLTYAPETEDLATVTDRMIDAAPRAATITRYDCPTYLIRCLGFTEPWTSGIEHLNYVSAAQPGIGTTWIAEASLSSPSWYQNTDLIAYGAGEKSSIDFFGITAPGQGANYVQSYNRGAQVRLNVPIASSSVGLTGTYSGATRQSRLYSGDTLLRQVNSSAMNWNLPAAAGVNMYRFELDVTGPSTWNRSTSSRSAWTFAMDQSADGTLPFISLGYGIPTDMAGAAKATGRLKVDITAEHEPTAIHTGEITGVTLEVSFDEGATWTAVSTTRGGSVWSGMVKLPKGAETLSLRTSAQDDAGNSVTQEIITAAIIG